MTDTATANGGVPDHDYYHSPVDSNNGIIADHDYDEEVARTTTTSSEEWKDRGAATMVKNESDENGIITSKVIKKGVKDFSFGKTLGEGSYSTVVMASDRQSLREYAIKVLDKRHIIKEKKVKYVNIEKNTLNRLGDHPGIIRLYYTFQDERSLYFVLDFAPNGELLSLIKRMGSLDEEGTRYYGSQILDAVEYMHSKGVIHRDLKPENVLLDDKMRIRITDFGTAKLLEEVPGSEPPRYPDDVRAKSFVGTAEYVSPELLTDKYVGRGCDLWAFGCILYQLIAGRPPFKASNEYQTFQKIVKLQYSYPPGFPMAVRDVVKRVLVLNPMDRASIPAIKSLGFFQGIEWDRKSIWKKTPPRLQPFKPSTNNSTSATNLNPTTPGGLVGGQRNATAKLLRQPHHYFQQQQQQPPPNDANNVPAQQSSTSASAAAKALKQQHQQNQYALQHQQHNNNYQYYQSANLAPPSTQPSSAPASPTRPGMKGRRKSSQNQVTQRQQQEAKEQQQPQDNYHQQNSSDPITAKVSNLKLDTTDGTLNKPPPQQAPNKSTTSSPKLEKKTSTSQFSTSPKLEKKKSQPVLSSQQYQIPEPTQLDAQYASFLQSYDERILKAGQVGVLTHQSGRSSTGSQAGDSDDSADMGGGTNKEPNKFKKFFGGGSSNGSHKKKRTVLVTTQARLLILDDKPKVKTEILLSTPQVQVREYQHNKKSNVGSFSVETKNKIYTIEDNKGSSEWISVIDKSRVLHNQYLNHTQQQAATTATAAALAATGSHHLPTSPNGGNNSIDNNYIMMPSQSSSYDANSSVFLQKNEERKKSRQR